MSNYLDCHKAAVYANLSRSQLAKLRSSGEGPLYLRVGRKILYRTTDIDDWLAVRSHRETSEYAVSSTPTSDDA